MTGTLIDFNDSVCAFGGHHCAPTVRARGGYDAHHEIPKFLGGAEDQSTMLVLCPNHHRRQHALIRYLIEATEATVGGTVHLDAAVLRGYSPAERAAANAAYIFWTDHGRQHVTYWECAAARS